MTKTQENACRKRMCKRLHTVLTTNFESANLLTLEYANAIPASREFEMKQYSSWMHLAKRIAGGAFEYVKITEYGTETAPLIRYRIITNLPEKTCADLAENWFMGKATVERLDAAQLAGIAESVRTLPAAGRDKFRRTWSTSHYLSWPASALCS